MEETIKKLVDMIIDGGIKILLALIVIGLGFWVTKILLNVLKKSKTFKKVDKSLQAFLSSFVSIGGKILTLLISAAIVGIPTTSLITVLGSAGVAIGLALQGGLSNIAGGIMLLFFKPFTVGDHISDGTTEGIVNDINLFYTELTTFNNEKISLPNGVLSNSTIINYTSLPERRVRLSVPVSYKNDIEKVKSLILDVISKEQLVLHDKTPGVTVENVVDGTVTFSVKAWVKTEDYWDVYYSLNEKIRIALDKNKIEVPFVTIKYTQDK